MVRRFVTAGLSLGMALVAAWSCPSAHAVDPQPLESAYWRLEEGIAGQSVPTGVDGSLKNTVLDSINDNRMQAYNPINAPLYVNDDLPPTYLRSGERNNLAWKVEAIVDGLGNRTGGQDVYTSDNEPIQNGIVGGSYVKDGQTIASTTTGFTLEAAFNPSNFDFLSSIVAKEGRPGLKQGIGDDNFQALPTMALKVRGGDDPDRGKLQIELFDQSGALKSISTADALQTDQWYYAAVVNDGTTLSLYLDHNDGQGYQLEGSTAVNGALFQGLNPEASDWNYNWTIGRATYGGLADDGITPFEGGRPSDWFTGFIDEVRLTNEALDPSEFLFTQTRLGDLNADGKIDGDDFLAWQRGYGSEFDDQDYADWVAGFGNNPAATPSGQGVPEPAGLSLATMAVFALLRRRRLG